jgi:hypothetical protein
MISPSSLSNFSPETQMIAQSGTGTGSAYVPPPTMTSGGAILQPPKASDITPSIPTSTTAPTTAPTGSTATSGTKAGESTVLSFNGGQLTGDSSGLSKVGTGGTVAQAQAATPTDPAAEQRRIDYIVSRYYGGDTSVTDQYKELVAQGKVSGGSVNPGAATMPRTLAPTSGPNINLIPAPPSAGAPGAIAAPGSAANLATSTNAAAPGTAPAGTTPLTGNEGPYRVAPTMSGGLQQLLEKLQGEAGRQLLQPTMWDDALASQVVDQQKRGINEDYAGAQEGLNAELASRGINWSSIAGGRHLDLATRKAQALGDVDTNIAHERANALAEGRRAAFANASGLAGSQFGMEQGLQNAERDERGYLNQQQQQAYENSLQQILAQHSMTMQDDESWQNAIMQGLNYGQGTAGTSALGAASNINAATGSQYGDQAAASNAGLSQLLQLAMQFYGGGQ